MDHTPKADIAGFTLVRSVADTTGLNWKEDIIWCLENVIPDPGHSQTQSPNYHLRTQNKRVCPLQMLRKHPPRRASQRKRGQCSPLPQKRNARSLYFRHGLVGDPASPLSSDTPASPQMLVAAASPRFPVPATSLSSIGPPSAPSDSTAQSSSVVPQMPSATTTPSWLLPPSTPPWAVSTGELGVCAIGLLPS
ncbi:hypothetical protein DPX16_7458 [Anabarilius grahami]|uniref:Uncharacterized protein n=1 Tax=Anabarilius grahami TaxID=495550 RepID=A0A3N0YLE4_ANAGA|nr:hypothetical protein DPX16_7458 [Anabarilius grahami]